MGITRTEVGFASGEQGVLFEPEGTTPAGAVVILHERYGLVQHTLDLAAKLARDGYMALAPDLFSLWEGDKEALFRGDVRVNLLDAEVAGTVNQALDFLKVHPHVDPTRLVVMGVCQSGRYAVVVGRQRQDLAALVVFYGVAKQDDWVVNEIQPVPMTEMIAQTTAPSLYVFGEADNVISLDDVLRTRAALEEHRKSYRMKIFADAPHGWLNDTMPGRYRPREAEEAWQMLLAFLDETLDRRWPAAGRVVWELESNISPTYDFSRNVRYE